MGGGRSSLWPSLEPVGPGASHVAQMSNTQMMEWCGVVAGAVAVGERVREGEGVGEGL